ncbi:murein L,D-transpeptidase [Hyphomicrobium sulfonivorans]|uniref:murein L,D-transpeptidase n=1 Tax=Hyphomicrobium sulfonivorans TaxID=121290 RepID=UPI001570EB1F|nr:murein L,D-transpeptidase [Hyphomicrobium sulfonivorans]MBI1648628.1 murein L,D-transpeptidase [Hyphomicrobium sulfonivorans]
MTKSIAYIKRAALTVCAAVAILGPSGTAPAYSLDMTDIDKLRTERKRANKSGKLPLPGTPDLNRLDERLSEAKITPDTPLFFRFFKAESEMEIWAGDENGNYSLFATYPICYWSGKLGPKLKEGDKQAPEGFYTINLEQSYHKGPRWPRSLNLGYPNPFDKINLRSGSYILIHGGCSSVGCFAMTNASSKEIHKLATQALEGGQSHIPVHVFPFRMTEENFAKYDAPKWQGFWRNLKEGYDLFERTKRPPRVSVCGLRYTVSASDRLEGVNPGPLQVCPETEQVIADLSHINKRVAEQPQVKPQTTEIKTASISGPAAYFTGPTASRVIANRLGDNFELQLAPQTSREGISPVLAKPLQCSLALPSCRKYADLREQIAHKTAMKLEEPKREKARAPKKKKKSATKKKKRSSKSSRRTSSVVGETRHVSSGEHRRWNEVQSVSFNN